MKIVAFLILGYFMIGFLTGLWILESKRSRRAQPASWTSEDRPFEMPLMALLLCGFLALPVVGYRRAVRQGSFWRISARIWLWGPPGLALIGFFSSFLAVRYL
jgi:hypothetical protein